MNKEEAEKAVKSLLNHGVEAFYIASSEVHGTHSTLIYTIADINNKRFVIWKPKTTSMRNKYIVTPPSSSFKYFDSIYDAVSFIIEEINKEEANIVGKEELK